MADRLSGRTNGSVIRSFVSLADTLRHLISTLAALYTLLSPSLLAFCRSSFIRRPVDQYSRSGSHVRHYSTSSRAAVREKYTPYTHTHTLFPPPHCCSCSPIFYFIIILFLPPSLLLPTSLVFCSLPMIFFDDGIILRDGERERGSRIGLLSSTAKLVGWEPSNHNLPSLLAYFSCRPLSSQSIECSVMVGDIHLIDVAFDLARILANSSFC